jgi:mannose-6-phosphate isomerase-like protein (cupin superfamily)
MKQIVPAFLGAIAFGAVSIAAQQSAAPAASAPRAAAQQQPPPPAPAPGSPGTYKSNAELMETLRKNMASAQGGMSSSAVSNTDQYRINVVHRDHAAGAIAHPGNTELHYIIDGAGTIVTGGTILRGAGGANAATIDNGVTRHVVKGDVVIIPANTPHWYKEVEGGITYLEVRFVAPSGGASR